MFELLPRVNASVHCTLLKLCTLYRCTADAIVEEGASSLSRLKVRNSPAGCSLSNLWTCFLCNCQLWIRQVICERFVREQMNSKQLTGCSLSCSQQTRCHIWKFCKQARQAMHAQQAWLKLSSSLACYSQQTRSPIHSWFRLLPQKTFMQIL